ncbi:methyltransferase [Paramyrothecium foliicola]|nr:methyltransferase [Paramyrothecium foliicola]
MAGHNSYLPGHRASQVKHHEWRTAENSAAFLLPVLRTKTLEIPKLQMLDVGAGSGTITTSLAKYIPDGTVTATDLSEDILKRARELADAAGVGQNIVYKQANVYSLPFPDGQFHITHAHQVLSHLDAPVDALREMIRVTKPGGTVAVRESDLRTWCCWPEMAEINRFHEILYQVHENAGGSTNCGRQLVSFALAAGASREQIEASYSTWCYSQPDDKHLWANAMAERLRDGEMRKASVRLGISTGEEMDKLADGWEKWANTEDASFGMMHGEILIHK